MTMPPIRSYDFVHSPSISLLNPNQPIFQFSSYNHSFKLNLKIHEDFAIANSVINVYYKGGEYQTPLSNHQVYTGEVYVNGNFIEEAWCRIVIQDIQQWKFEGVVSTPMGLYTLQQIQQYDRSKRDLDVEIASPFSRVPGAINSKLILLKDEEPDSSNLGDSNLSKRTHYESACGTPDPSPYEGRKLIQSISKALVQFAAGDSSGCPATKKILLMGVAADCTYVKDKGSIANALTSILSIWATVSAVFEASFNVQLGVNVVNIQETCTPSTPFMKWNSDCTNKEYTLSKRLSDFSQWRGQKEKDSVGLWHLMTKCSSQPAVGVAWLSTLCTTNSNFQDTNGGAYVSGTGVSAIVPSEWKVVAHEIGHNFGAIHDCSAGTCPAVQGVCTPCKDSCDCKGQFLMNTMDTSTTDTFSPGSMGLICPTIASKGSCLMDPGSVKLIKSGICGNGVKEDGEDCDCGGIEGCAGNSCCDGTICKYKQGARCDPRNDGCCTDSCQLQSSNVVCHESIGICDTKKFCTGTSTKCPDSFLPDGTICNVNGTQAQCSSGLCTSRDLQCTGKGNGVTIVSSCPAFENGCALTCQDTNGNCYSLNGNFMDGTTCSGSGTCQSGQCVGWTIWSLVALYLRLFPLYTWPVLIVTLMLLISIIWTCCIRPCCFPTPNRSKWKEPQEVYVYPANSNLNRLSTDPLTEKYPGEHFPESPTKRNNGDRFPDRSSTQIQRANIIDLDQSPLVPPREYLASKRVSDPQESPLIKKGP
ncbi:Metallo-peptidase family M12B Reprolysin-like-domain-containing protein [Globomyces pollinis-pini]|nr:Metallo-peptidase family M12B Reprolysin-like-domain-containing protein [Globomyces pollinis-pini]